MITVTVKPVLAYDLQWSGDLGVGALGFAIGDTDNDIIAARAANVQSCAVGWGYAPLNTLVDAAPDYFFEKPLELVQIVNNGTINK